MRWTTLVLTILVCFIFGNLFLILFTYLGGIFEPYLAWTLLKFILAFLFFIVIDVIILYKQKKYGKRNR